MAQKMMKTVTGPPKSGKTTVAQIFSQKYGLAQLSIGSVMRMVLDTQGNTDLAIQMKEYLLQGLVVPDELAIQYKGFITCMCDPNLIFGMDFVFFKSRLYNLLYFCWFSVYLIYYDISGISDMCLMALYWSLRTPKWTQRPSVLELGLEPATFRLQGELSTLEPRSLFTLSLK
uniref:Uncharacterized protein n=1 Tax=Pundamilia nyererei TaxID=303518 RepID=A0A3B4FSF9_9CICH